MSNTEALPPLPEPSAAVVYNWSKGYTWGAYTADQMREYARAALAQPAASGEPVAYWHKRGQDEEQFIHAAAVNGVCPDCVPLYTTTQPAPARVQAVTPGNVGRWCMSEDECRAMGIDFAAYERGVADAAEAFGRNKP